MSRVPERRQKAVDAMVEAATKGMAEMYQLGYDGGYADGLRVGSATPAPVHLPGEPANGALIAVSDLTLGDGAPHLVFKSKRRHGGPIRVSGEFCPGADTGTRQKICYVNVGGRHRNLLLYVFWHRGKLVMRTGVGMGHTDKRRVSRHFVLNPCRGFWCHYEGTYTPRGDLNFIISVNGATMATLGADANAYKPGHLVTDFGFPPPPKTPEKPMEGWRFRNCRVEAA